MPKPSIDLERLTDFRKELHRHPEVSGGEVETAKRVRALLEACRPDEVIGGLGGHGVAAVFEKSEGASLLIRCELDALPIAERNTFPHRSVKPRVSHKCGHDGHMAILTGTGEILQRRDWAAGRVGLLFQPAEEDGSGARRVIDDPRFEEIVPDHVVALHNMPGHPLGTVLCRAGTFTPAVTSLIIALHGKTSHAAEPEKGINPALAIAEILTETRKLEKPDTDPSFALVTPIQIEMGAEAYGVSAGEGNVKFTLRAWDNGTLAKLSSDVESIVERAAARYGLGVDVSWTQQFSATTNAEVVVEAIRAAAEENRLPWIEMTEPVRWGEDFGLFTENFPGAMFGLGAGETTEGLHSPDYDFPDALIPIGVGMLHSIVRRLLNDPRRARR